MIDGRTIWESDQIYIHDYLQIIYLSQQMQTVTPGRSSAEVASF